MAPEIAIRGAGPVGCVLALLLRNAGRAVQLHERRARAAPAGGPRPIALSYASRLILERAGAWRALAPTPIEQIRVSQAGQLGRTHIGAQDAGLPALGYVIDYGALAAALAAEVDAAGIPVEYGSETDDGVPAEARLMVHAEGLAGDAAEKRYRQDAVLALVGVEPRARHTAHERFTAEGPLALLPLDGRFAVVWGTAPARAERLVAAPAGEFLEALSLACGARIGRFLSVEGRAAMPLALRVRAARLGERAVYVGNAAQTLHPVAGQGLNLGLRDAWELAQAVREAPDPGDAAVLAAYAASRRLDAFATIRVTDLLANLFLGANPLAGAARGIAMLALDACTPARRFLARRMIYGASALP
jgi:2-octaprenyl-6-methoxyphenol hydroxylase